jgi:hypothetical protein
MQREETAWGDLNEDSPSLPLVVDQNVHRALTALDHWGMLILTGNYQEVSSLLRTIPRLRQLERENRMAVERVGCSGVWLSATPHYPNDLTFELLLEFGAVQSNGSIVLTVMVRGVRNGPGSIHMSSNAMTDASRRLLNTVLTSPEYSQALDKLRNALRGT